MSKHIHLDKDCPWCASGIPLKEYVRVPIWKGNQDPLVDLPDAYWEMPKEKYERLIKLSQPVQSHEKPLLPCEHPSGRNRKLCISASKPKCEEGKLFTCPFCGSVWKAIPDPQYGNKWMLVSSE